MWARDLVLVENTTEVVLVQNTTAEVLVANTEGGRNHVKLSCEIKPARDNLGQNSWYIHHELRFKRTCKATLV